MGLIQLPNSKAISLWAYVPPYLPDFEYIPMAFVALTHFFGVRLKEFKPASFLKVSNSTPLKLGL